MNLTTFKVFFSFFLVRRWIENDEDFLEGRAEGNFLVTVNFRFETCLSHHLFNPGNGQFLLKILSS